MVSFIQYSSHCSDINWSRSRSTLSTEQIEDLYDLKRNRIITSATAQEILEIVLEDPTQQPSDVNTDS